jgi:hypothetical protein
VQNELLRESDSNLVLMDVFFIVLSFKFRIQNESKAKLWKRMAKEIVGA